GDVDGSHHSIAARAVRRRERGGKAAPRARRYRRRRHLHRHLPRRRGRCAARGHDARALPGHGRGRGRAPRGGGPAALAAPRRHRCGRLEPGEDIVLVVTAAAHRQDAFAAAEFLMDYLKTRAPFWKQVEYPDRKTWVDAKQSDDALADRWTRPGGGREAAE